MKIIDRYIFRELTLTFILSISLLLSAFFIQQILRLSRISSETGVSFLLLIKLAPFIIPLFLVLAIPLSVLISSTLTFSRLSTDREITAMRSAGISMYRMLPPVVIFSMGAFLLALFSSTTIQPMVKNYIKQQAYKTLKGQRTLGLHEGVFNNLFNLLVYTKKVKGPDTFEGVLISDRSLEESRIITARRGRFLSDPSTENLYIKLENGRIHFESEDREKYQRATFSTYYLRLETTGSIENIRLFKEVWGMSLKELKKRAAEKMAEGKGREYNALMVELHKKFSFPAAVLVLGILGVPIGIKSKFSSRFAGFILSIIVIFCYYIIDAGFEILAVEGIIDPVWAAWIPATLFLFTTVYAILVIARDRD